MENLQQISHPIIYWIPYYLQNHHAFLRPWNFYSWFSSQNTVSNELELKDQLLQQRKASKKLFMKQKIQKYQIQYNQLQATKKSFQRKLQTNRSWNRPLTKLDFGMDWSNDNRNIVPNIVNQIVSYLLKQTKSGHLINKIFKLIPHETQWTLKKFYGYLKRAKNKMAHYVNERDLQTLIRMQDTSCEMYKSQEQQFYIEVCRRSLLHFLRDNQILICMTSKRMSKFKRKLHLIARRALVTWLQQMVHFH